MQNFEYENSCKIFFGKGEISKLGKNILKYGSKILLVYGKGSIKTNGIYDAVISELKNNNIQWFELDGVDPNPRITTVKEGERICKENNIEMVLAVGGGSTIDCAKAIAVAALDEGDVWEIWEYKRNPERALPVASVLTLAATGSEMNEGSVITNELQQKKNGYGHPSMLPKFSVMDPEYTYTVSKYHTAAGVVDIMAHIFEFYFNQVKSDYLQARMSEAVLKTCIKYGKTAVENPENYEARANLMWAGSLALNGIIGSGVSFDGFNHMVEHNISAIYDLTHGAGLSILLTHWMEYVLDDGTLDRLYEYGKNVWEIEGTDRFEVAEKGISMTREFFRSLGMPIYFSEAGIDDPNIELILEKTWSPIGTFKTLSKEEMRTILERAACNENA